MKTKLLLEKNKEIYDSLLKFIETVNDSKDEFRKLIDIIQFHKITQNKEDFQSFLHLLTKISKNHNRLFNFFDKIEQILIYFAKCLNTNFSNIEIFNIFENNKRILLFLIQKEIIKIGNSITKLINKKKDSETMKYSYYFYPEIKLFVGKKKSESIKKEIISLNPNAFNDFEEKRQKGENDSYICSLIRDDSVEEFISYINRMNVPLSSTIKTSFFETNSFLIENDHPSLIEYTAFYGSIQIFQYLRFNNVDLTSSLWLFAIHSNNPELIHLLEENHVEPKDKSFEKCFKESIKCHHNEIAFYIKENLLNEKVEIYNLTNDYNKNQLAYSFAYYNYAFIPDDFGNHFIFYYLCHYNYINLVKLFIKENDIDINEKIIKRTSFYQISKRKYFNRVKINI